MMADDRAPPASVRSTSRRDGTRVAIANGISSGRFCKINITMDANKISRIDYLGPTGGFISRGEQCAFALQQCVKQ
jgi:hypothetical protein